MSHARVLVVPSERFDRLGRFQGFSDRAEHYLGALLEPGSPSFRPRAEVEDDPGFKQLIPYVIFRSGGAVFCYTRGTSQGERRLHALRSLGVGGHVEEHDAGGTLGMAAYEAALAREIDEEVAVELPGTPRLVGLINDDSTPVGSVHLGVVHLVELERPAVHPREDGLREAGFVPIARVREERGRFETWSRFCIDSVLGGGAPGRDPSA